MKIISCESCSFRKMVESDVNKNYHDQTECPVCGGELHSEATI